MCVVATKACKVGRRWRSIARRSAVVLQNSHFQFGRLYVACERRDPGNQQMRLLQLRQGSSLSQAHPRPTSPLMSHILAPEDACGGLQHI